MTGLISAFAALLVSAASPAVAPQSAGVLSEFSLTSWTESDGIPLGSIHALAQDAEGYLWIGADSGLIRFDGARFVPRPSFVGEPLPQAPVLALCATNDHSLWIGFGDSAGVRRIRDGKVEMAGAGDDLKSVTALAQDDTGTIWAISDSRVFRFINERWERVRIDDADNLSALNLYVGSTGRLYVGATTGVWQQIEDGHFLKRHGTWSWAVLERQSGGLWVSDQASGFSRPGASMSATPSMFGNGYRLVQDRHGNLWVATIGQGLWRVREDTAGSYRIDSVNLNMGMLSDAVPALLEDREGDLWIGTTAGLQRLSRRLLTPVSEGGLVVSLEATSDSVWAGTQHGLVRYPQTEQGRRSPRKITDEWTLTLHRDKQGTLWAASPTGVRRIVNGEPSRPISAEVGTVRSITSDNNGNIWLLSSERGVLRWANNVVTPIELPPNAPRPALLFVDSHDVLWIALQGGGLVRRDERGTLKTLGPKDGYGEREHSTIYAIAEDASNVIWIGGDRGLSRFDGRVTTFSQRQGLPSDRVWAVVPDPSGHLWLNMDVGVVRVLAADLAGSSIAGARLRYAMFNAADGLAGAAIRNVRAVRSTDGRIWLMRGGNLTLLDPEVLRARDQAVANSVRIEGAIVDDVRVEPTSSRAIGPGIRSLQVSYTALSLALASKIRFRYKLDGFDTDWISAGSRRVAYYTNLPPGNYQFRVEAESTDGPAAAQQWNFSILPRFYQTRAFTAACVAAVLMLLWGAWQFRIALLQREFAAVLAERARLSREMHDTLLQSLVGLALQLGVIAGHVGVPRSIADGMARVRRQLETHIKEARQSIWDLRSTSRADADVVNVIRDFGQRATSNTAISFALTASGNIRRCSPKLEHHMLRIAQEGITNAVRHSSAEVLQVMVAYATEAVTIRIVDDGCGFNPQLPASNRHYGLIGMRERAADIGGDCRIVTAPSRGTEITVTLPIRAVLHSRIA